jgi:cell volume regulation protein A
VTEDVLLTLSLLLVAALMARLLASVLRVPEILVLVAMGAIFGPHALDVVDVPIDSLGAQLMFTLGVSLILFYGGLSLSLPVLRSVWVALGLLVVPGVVATALVTGLVAYLVFDLSFTASILLGAVLAPTDPAILIPLFIRTRLRPKLTQTIVAESAFNDPIGAALALALAGVVISGEASVAEPVGEFALDLAISTVIGVIAGVGLAAAISSRRAGVWRESSALAVLTVVTISYFSLDSAGGSGYLGAFLAGLIVGNMDHLGLAMHSVHEREMRIFSAGAADLVTLFVFVVLGANIPFDDLWEHLLPALAVLAALLLIARPLVVLACTLPDRRARWTPQEILFLCWTRETGVVPAALVGVLAGLGVPDVELYASVVALAIVLTLLLQALPASRLAARLGLLDGPRPLAAETSVDVEAGLAASTRLGRVRADRSRRAAGSGRPPTG